MTKTERERARQHLYKQKGSDRLLLSALPERQAGPGNHRHGRRNRSVPHCRRPIERSGRDRSGIKKFIGPEQKRITIQQLLDGLT